MQRKTARDCTESNDFPLLINSIKLNFKTIDSGIPA